MAILWLLTCLGGRLVAQENIAVWKFPQGVTDVTCVSSGISADDCSFSYVGNVNTIGTNNSNTTLCGDTDNTKSLQVVGQDGGSVIFKISTLPYRNIVVSYDLRCHPTQGGNPNYAWSYSFDGVNFTNAPAATAISNFEETTFTTMTADFSSVTSLYGRQAVWFKLTMSGASSNVTTNLDNVVFTGLPFTCMAPQNVAAVANDSPSEAVVSWEQAGSNETSYTVVYYTGTVNQSALTSFASANVNTVANATSPQTITGLDANTTYYIYVRANCGEGDMSMWSDPAVVTTPAVCAIADLSAVTIGGTTATLTWNTEAANSMVRVFAAATENPWGTSDGLVFEQTVADTFCNVTGLQYSTSYYAYVRSVCSQNNISEPISTSFTTYFADNVVETIVGDGTAASYTAPFNNLYKISWNQSIYTLSEIGYYGTIGTISWYSNSTSTVHYSDLRIYMGVTSMTAAETTSSWVPMSDLTLVYSSNDYTAGGAQGWETFILNTPFEYDGTGNLVVVVAKNTGTGSYNSSVTYRYTSISNRVLYKQSDSDASCAQHPGTATGTRSSYLPNIKLGYGNYHAICRPVSALAANNITTTSAVVSWVAGTVETAWMLKYGESGFDVESEGTTLNLTDTTTSLTGLLPSTMYDVYVKAVCGVGEESGWSMISFATACDAVVVDAANPFSEDFTGLTTSTFPPQCWSQQRTAVGTGSSGTDYPNGAWTLYTSTQGTGSTPPMAQLRDSRAGARHNLVTTPMYMATGSYSVSVRVYRNATGTSHTVEGINLYLSKTSDLVSVGSDVVDLGFISRNYTVASEVNSEFIGAESSTGWYTYNVPFNISTDGVYYVIFEGRNNYGLSTYMDDVVVRTLSSEAEITSFSLAEQASESVINSEAATVTTTVSYQTASLAALVPTITVSDYASISPASGIAQDFSSPVTYTVTAEDGTTKEWTISVMPEAVASSAKDIIAFSFSGQQGEAVIDAENHTVLAYAAWNYNLTLETNKIAPSITVSPLATIYPVSDSAINFASPVNYTVTAEDESTQIWTVTIVNDPNACVNPLASSFDISNLTSSTATVAWVRRYTETSYNVKVSTTAMTDMTATADVYDGVVNDTVIALTGLAENTLYHVYVQSACGVETWVSTTFRTIITPATIPYNHAFEDATENNAWVLENGTQTNIWYIGTASNNGGNGLYISNDNGTTNAYTIGSISFVYAYRTISMGTGDYVISYDWKAQGESQYYDYLRVWLAPVSFTITPGQTPDGGTSVYNYYAANPAGWIPLDEGHSMNQVSSWQSKTLTASISAGTYNLVFMWANDGSGGTQPPASVDNISITQITCPVVSDLEASNITTASAEITWTERGTATAWDVVLSATALTDEQLAAATPEAVDAASYQATGLTANTPYYIYVRAHCSDVDQSDWVALQFRTACGENAIPYTENFNTYSATAYSTAGVMPDCWSVIYNGTNAAYSPHVSNSTSYAPMSGADVNYLSVVSGASAEAYGNDNIVILPSMDGGYVGRTISFDVKTSNAANSTLNLGYMNGNTFVNVEGIQFATSLVSFSKVVPNSVPADAVLALRFSATTSTVYYGIDNVVVRETSTDNTILSYSATTTQGDAICAVDNEAHTISVELRSGFTAPGPIGQTIVLNDVHATITQQVGADFITPPNYFGWFMTTTDTTITYKVTAENGAEQLYTATITVEECAAPSALVAEQTSTTNVNCSWTTVEGTTAWNFYCSTTQLAPTDLDALTASDYTTVTSAVASHTVVGETTYYWYVRTDCGGSYSAWMESSFTTWENCVAPTNVTTAVENDNNIVVSWDVQDNLPIAEAFGIGTDSFERTDVNGGSLTYTNGTYPWSIVSSDSHSGSKSLVSASGNHSTTSQIDITIDYSEPFDFSFWYKVSSESGWDYFYFYLDGTQKLSNSGTVAWTQYTTTLAPGSHTLSWRYTKDGSGNSGSDCVWIDDVVLPMNTMVAGGNSSVVVYKNDALLATVPATQTHYIDEGLEAGNYCYKVKTICREGSESDFSASVCQEINSCFVPTNLSATAVTANSATLSWTRGDEETAWNLTVNGGATVALTEASEGVTVNGNVITYALAGLEPMTDYTITIQSDCGGSVSQSVASVDFTTERVPATLPYTCDFEDAVANNGWVLDNGEYDNKWYIGSAANNGGANGLYITNDNGATNAYTTSPFEFVYAYRMINVENASEYVVSYDWKAYGEGNYDYIRAWLAPASFVFTPGQTPGGTTSAYGYTSTTPDGWISLDGGSKQNGVTSWQTQNLTVDIPAGNYNLVFMWANDGSGGTQPPAAIDNINIHALTCPAVGDLAAAPANITNNSAVITWTERGTAEAWEIIVSATEITNFASATAVSVTDTTYSVTSLSAETTYHVYVRANCDVDDNSQWAHATFRTVASCPVPDGLATSELSGSSATITWNGYIASNWTLEYRIGTTGNWTVVENLDATSYTFATVPTTTYNVRVKAVCGVDEESAYSATFSFTTPCGAITNFPWNEGFENGYDCWTLVDQDGDGQQWYQASITSPSAGSLGNHGGTYMMTSASWNSSDLTPNNWLISPALDLSGLSGTVKMSYFVGGQDNAWPSEHYKVCVSTSSTVSSFTTILFEETIPESGWQERNINLSDYIGQVIYVAFVHYNCTGMFRLDLDDISVYEDNSTDATISAITAPTHGDYSTCALTNAEQIKINILNNGGSAISNFEVSYSINNGTTVTETVTTSVDPAENYEYTFAQTVDLSAVGTYTIVASVNLTGDENVDNDTVSLTITSGDATVRIHALTDNGGGQSWLVTNTETNEIVAQRTTGWQWGIEVNDYVCLDASQCYRVAVNDADGMSSPAYLEILYNGVQVAGSTDAGSFDGPSLVAERFSQNCQSGANDIITFSVPDMINVDINNENHTVTAEISYNTAEELSSLIPVITVSEYAEITLVNGNAYTEGVAQDFTSSVVYTVKAENNETQDWTVTVTRASAPSSEKNIIAFSFNGQIGESVIDATAHTVTAYASWNINIENPITPTIEVSPMATISPASGVAQTFTSSVTYTVTAEDETTQEWNVTITQDPSSLASLPYTCDFEDDAENANWALDNGTLVNAWHIGAAANNGGNNGLYISDNNGVDNRYETDDAESYVYAYRLFNVEEEGNYDISFDWRSNGEEGYDFLRAFVVPTTAAADFSAGNDNGIESYNSSGYVPTGWIDIAQNAGELSAESDWLHSEKTVSLVAGRYNIVFFWENDDSYGDQTPAAIDNIRVRSSVFTVTSSHTGLGTISPEGETEASDGTEIQFTVTPMDGFMVSSLMVDGVDRADEIVDNVFVLTVHANHTVVANFDVPHTINASSGANGTITPNGLVQVGNGESKTFVVASSAGYQISSVLVDGEEQIEDDDVVRVTYNYTFNNVRTDHIISASFNVAPSHIIVATASEGGSISPSGNVEVPYNGSQTFEFTPDEGYRLANVTVDNLPVTVENNAYTISNVITDRTINANFTANSYNLTIHYVYADNTTAAPDHTSSHTFGANYSVASPEITGYTADIDTVAGTMTAQDVEVYVTYNINSYNLTIHYVYADNTEAAQTYTETFNYGAEYSVVSPVIPHYTASQEIVSGTMPAEDVDETVTYTAITFTITATAGANGTITPNGAVVVTEGAGQNFEISANTGYRISDVLVDGQSVGAVESYAFTNVTENHTIEASFETIPVSTYTIVATAGANGAITPSGSVTVNEGADQSFAIAANAGYHIASVLVDGESVGAVESYTFQNVTANHTIEATFEVDFQNTYTITATAGANGTITPNGTVTVNEGTSMTFAIAANAGYRIADVLVDGQSVGAVGSYTFQNVTANHTIEASFEASSSTTYTIIATNGNNGTISPSGVVYVAEGANQTFTITPNAGYRIATVMVDGVNAIDEVVDFQYTFYNVTADHNINVTFTNSDAVDEYISGSMSVYPNPNNGMFSIDFANISGDATYQLIDARGALVETRDINVMDGDTMNFNYDLRPGTYFVRIITTDRVYVEQIVVE